MALIDIVKYESKDNGVFAWKFPNEELSTKTQLIVNESQAAVLFKGGKAYDVFEPGRHTLDTNNIPLLNKIVNLPFGNESPFKAEIWFVNLAHTLDIKWGTASPVSIQDPKYGIFIPISSFGQFGITVNDPKLFLKKLVGTLPSFDKDNVVRYFRGFYTQNVKDQISKYLVNNKITILELGAHLNQLSQFMKDGMKSEFNDYGIELLNFYVEDISVPETDEGIARLKDALSKRAEMEIVGFDYQQERKLDVMEGAAKNTGSTGGMMGAGVGLGVGNIMGHEMGKLFKDDLANATGSSKKECSGCHFENPEDAKFCSNCAQLLDDTIKSCSKCGTKALETNQKFCHSCGTSLLDGCKKCGASLPNNAKFCLECGEKVDDNE